ncbi:putative defense protein 3 [Daphnia carinata]|uniref:putative defense protein 3 n=1 Tax=Daphnia carinata TaxID=120202 RepID=UPI0028693A2C|nr:putative defense protein 3 [Daphnia carinata]
MLATSFVILSAFFAAQIEALPSGAPVSSCSTMMPFHIPFLFVQQGVAPFSITLSSQTASPQSPITVTLKANSGGPAFKGYLIQARSGKNIQAVGTFTADGQSNTGKTINCPGGIKNAVTHTSRTDKTSETFLWTPPANFKGQVVMMATVVVRYNQIYKGVQSSLITRKKKG